MSKFPRYLLWGIPVLLVIGAALVWGLSRQKITPPARASLIGLSPGAATTPPGSGDYQFATGPGQVVFPRDFGPHPGFLTEWWYYTGNLQSADGRRFGFQLTFFRRSVTPQKDWSPRASDLSTNQVYMAHFALTDVSARQFHYFEHFERGAAGLAGAEIDPSFQVWLDAWSVQQIGPNTYHLKAPEQGVAIDLTLTDTKGPVLEGDRGYSQKGPEPGNASLYFSQTHLDSRGSVTVQGQTYPVNGLSWMDREISTSVLGKGEVGWDWFALHLDDGTELMAYVLRRSDGSIDQFSQGTYIQANGETVHLTRDDFQILTEATWKSPHSGGVYPSRWRLRVPSLKLDLEIQPFLPDQELNVSYTYWEGAVGFSGTRDGQSVAGQGYVELTGYAKSMEGAL
jgi:predicted secreted hydrolase